MNSTSALRILGTAIVAGCLGASVFAQDSAQELKIQKALDRLAKCETRVAAGESFKRLELEFHGLRQDLGRLPQDDPRVKEAFERYQKAYDTSRGGAAKPQPRPEGDKPAPEEGAPHQKVLEAQKLLDEVEAALPTAKGRAAIEALKSKAYAAADTLRAAPTQERKHSQWKAASARQQELVNKLVAMSNAAIHPQADQIAQIDAQIRTQLNYMKRDGKFEEAARTAIPAAIDALAPQEHEAVAALRAKFAELLALEKAAVAAAALAAKRNENIAILKQKALGVDRQFPWIGQGTSVDHAKVFLSDMANRRALAEDARRVVDEMVAADPELPEIEQYAVRSCRDAPAAVERHLGEVRERCRKAAQDLFDQAAAAIASGKPASTILQAQKALQVCAEIDPDRAAEYQASLARTEEMIRQSGANLEAIRAEARAAERFPRPQLEGEPAEEIARAFLPLWRTYYGEPEKNWLKFAVTKPGWQYKEEITHDGARYEVYRYEWISVETAIAKPEDPSIVIVRDFELRRTPGAKEFSIYRSIGTVEMLPENLDK